MSEFVLLAALWSIGFTSEASQSLVINIDSPWINACNEYIDSQVKLQAIY